jgi:2-dehydro-3-deoxyphosphogluconate aldolase / (4S)-4-hydroxy-2-oxoglutarate aldolase
MARPVSALEVIEAAGVVPVAVIDDPADAAGLGDALIAGGLTCVEVTFRTPAALDAIRVLASDQRLMVGAGTVLTPEQARAADAAGARFVVSPGFDREVVCCCRELGVPPIPGIATATEAMAALREDLDTVKLFPAAAAGGLDLLDALAAPFPRLRFLPTGGIGPSMLKTYLSRRSVIAVGGTWITPRTLVREHRFDEVRSLAEAAAAAVAAVRRLEPAKE